MNYKDSVSGINVLVHKSEQLPYGNKSRGKFIPPEKGRRSIFVPSFGALEKEEVDYLVEVSQEQEDERIKKGNKSQVKENLEQVTEAMLQAPAGKRAKAGREIIGGKDVSK